MATAASIRRNVMLAICERWGSSSPVEELEDVFFSRHLARITSVPPLEIAQAFASERLTTPAMVAMPAGNFSAVRILPNISTNTCGQPGVWQKPDVG